jgi:hypothetical protein
LKIENLLKNIREGRVRSNPTAVINNEAIHTLRKAFQEATNYTKSIKCNVK